MKHLNFKLYYKQLHLKYLCNLARYWLQAVWRWHDSFETCSSVKILHLLVILQNNKRCTVQRIEIKKKRCLSYFNTFNLQFINEIQKYINNQQIRFVIYDVFYSQYFDQHVSAAIPAIFSVIFVITRIQSWFTASPSLRNNWNHIIFVKII